MFLVFLRFSNARSRAAELMAAHVAWLDQGFADGVFLIAGTLQPKLGGAILAHGSSREELDKRLREDPFVAHDVVSCEVLEVTPSKTDPRVASLFA